MTTLYPWTRFILPFATVFDAAGVTLPGALLYFYVSGTATPLDTYSDANRTIPNTNPVVADQSGRFGDIFLQDREYKVILETSANVQLWAADPVTVTIPGISTGVTSVADLKAISVSTLTTGALVTVRGYYTDGDGGGGVFWYDSVSAETDNGGTIIAPNSGGGRWKRLYELGMLDVLWFGAKADDATNNRLTITACIAAAPSGSVVYFPSGTYRTNGGFIINKPLILRGAGRGTLVKQTGITTSPVLFYMGGATQNGSPNPGYPGTVYNLGTGIFTAGQTAYACGNTSGLAVGDTVFCAFGIDPYDGGQHYLRQWNVVKTIVANTTVTLEVPLPEATTIGGGWGAFGFSPTFNELVKFTTIVENGGIENMALEQVAGPTYDTLTFLIRARNMFRRNLFVTTSQGGLAVCGEVDNCHDENLLANRTAILSGVTFVGVYGSKNYYGTNIEATIDGVGVFFENQNRGAVVENVILNASSTKQTNNFFKAVGGSLGIKFYNVHLNNIAQPNAQAASFAQGAEVLTDGVYLWGPNNNVFPLSQHTGGLYINGATYRDSKLWRRIIPLRPNMAGVAYSIPSGITIRMRGKVSSKTGITFIRFGNTTFANCYISYDPGNTVDDWPAAGTFADIKNPSNDTLSFGVIYGSAAAYQFNQDPNGKVITITTDGTVPVGATLVIEIETLRLNTGDDGVSGVEQTDLVPIITPRVTLAYSASITPNASQGNEFDITATNGTAFTVNAPSSPTDGQRITFTVRNAAGGAMGAITWDAVFKLAAFTNPANGQSRSIDFRYDVVNAVWVEVSRTPNDVPN